MINGPLDTPTNYEAAALNAEALGLWHVAEANWRLAIIASTKTPAVRPHGGNPTLKERSN